MVIAFLQRKIASENPVKIENANRDFEAFLDAIADKDAGTIALLMERYQIQPGGFIEKCVARMIAEPGDVEHGSYLLSDYHSNMGDE